VREAEQNGSGTIHLGVAAAGAAATMDMQLETERVVDSSYLYRIIDIITSGPDLQTILRGVVHLVAEATACNACFIHLRQGDDLVLRAASPQYAHLEGKISVAVGQGLTGWVVQAGRPAFIRENALSDSRPKYFPELDDDKFQSLMSVPIVTRDGSAIGAITLNAEAPHDATPEEKHYLLLTASLIASAVENAQLYEDATTKLELLMDLSRVARQIAAATDLDALVQMVVKETARIVGARSVVVYLADGADKCVLRAVSNPARKSAAKLPKTLGLNGYRFREVANLVEAELWPDRGGQQVLVSPLAAGEDVIGVIAGLLDTASRNSATALDTLAAHTAVAIKQLQLIERLTDRNRIAEFVDAVLSEASSDELATRAERVGFDLRAPHVVVHCIGSGTPRETALATLETELSRLAKKCLIDSRKNALRAVIPATSSDVGDVIEILEAARQCVPDERRSLTIGMSSICTDVALLGRSFEEAKVATEIGRVVNGGSGVFAYDDLGPYRYAWRLMSHPWDGQPWSRAIEALEEYDRRRKASLFVTLEIFLDSRGDVGKTAAAMYIHSNTVRQRLSRIRELTGIDVETADWVSLAMALKIAKLLRYRAER
jgi:sugar diacid utilization regulator